MAGTSTYILSGYGPLENAWLNECLGLFKRQAVNIRKVLFVGDTLSDHQAMVEIHFVLKPGQEDFWALFEAQLAQLDWHSRSISPPPPQAQG